MAETDNLSVVREAPVLLPTVAAPEAMLQVIALALGMDPNTRVELQKPDVNFLQEVAKLPVDFSGMPSGTDVYAMRNWVKDVLTDGPLGKYRANLGLNLRRIPAQEIRKEIFTVSRTDGNGSYGFWVFEPVSAQVDNQASSRPAILMFHGGGWIHGDPSGDEGELISRHLIISNLKLKDFKALSKAFASELDAVVFGIDYRLAPENPLPTPLDDCSDALQWVGHFMY
ncbi:hypothetical protein EIK77_003944 [Talaromyces pinophilus]|nr:hypothetical protein EIK77_003944 [Talaromyces pinophilus]